MSNEVLLAIVAAASGGIGWVGKFIKQYWEKKQIKKEHNEYINRLKAIADVYNSMDRLQSSERIDRVFLLEISNGGHSPRPGSKLYAKSIKITLEERNFSKEELINMYEKLPLDYNYIQMIINAQQEGFYYFDTEKEKPCMLKSLYQNEGIQCSEIYHIHTDIDEEKMFILSASTYNDPETFKGESFRAFLSTEIMVIRSNFKRYR